MTTIRAVTRQRREKMLQMRRGGTVGLAEEQLPLKRQVIHKLCQGIYGHGQCACAKALGKPGCERFEGLAQHLIDTVRRYDLRAREEISE